MGYWLAFILIAVTGCTAQGTYEDSRHMFTPTRPVPEQQPGWRQPPTLQIHRLATRADVHRACNDIRVGRRGSHYTMLGLHLVSIQDRGCYLHDQELEVGHIFYLDGDVKALKHEKLHHVHGPAHSGPPPMRGVRQMGGRSSQITGSRIHTAYTGGSQ